uniref:TOD1/MUCI70 glycosyltransferase-like domain-containing protein n=1 Tax=Triticum urartu TaxID=4572 RepID=A0A8R7P6B6_TRIUA
MPHPLNVTSWYFLLFSRFLRGEIHGLNTAFGLEEADLYEMRQCQGTVASAIFGNYDIMQQSEKISTFSKDVVCFMFLDEETEAAIKKIIDNTKRIGLWRVVVVHNLPYPDPTAFVKVPKLLLHRLFPDVRYSLWIDGKLKLVKDPYQLLERFLWRKNVRFAISRHYRLFDVLEEAEANKAGGKYDNASIDNQIEFYKREGLTHYSSAKFLITSGNGSSR